MKTMSVHGWLALAGGLSLACAVNVSPPELPVVTLEEAPPPIAGGTLAALRDGRTAVVADPDRDAIYVVDLDRGALTRRFEVEPGSEPGRIAEDTLGRAHVLLRRGGALLTFAPADPEPRRTPLCAAPRGIDAAGDGSLIVACADGALLEVDRSLAVHPLALLPPGLRDVAVLGDVILVTHLRSAAVHVLSREGATLRTVAPPPVALDGLPYTANTALRLRRQGERAWLLHQRSRLGPEPAPTDEYAGRFRGPCGESAVQVVVSEVGETGVRTAGVLRGGAFAVDLDAFEGELAIAVPSAIGGTPAQRQHRVRRVREGATCLAEGSPASVDGQPVAVAFGVTGELLVFSREPALLLAGERAIALSSESRRDTGHDLFHAAREGVACASCHAEGAEDGHLWTLGGAPPRRTSTLRGGILTTAPFHADGSVPSLGEVVSRQFPDVHDDARVGALGLWLDALEPIPVPPRDPTSVERGRLVFELAGCADCHAGPLGTRTQPGAQIPTLVDLADRGPYLSSGCASELEEVLIGPCSPPEHGRASELTDEDRAALVAYLRAR